MDNFQREKQVLAGLYLSKFDTDGLIRLGFESFTEAFNVIGFALGTKPASIKNYRDEFDPFFPNSRKGWHKRSVRNYCLDVLNKYESLSADQFSELLQSLLDRESKPITNSVEDPNTTTFAQRLMTGQSAEKYFESVHPQLEEFRECTSENTTDLGCGYDFKLTCGSISEFLAVEVKGLQANTGAILLTEKEYLVASKLRARYLLFVVRNFRERPFHTIYRDPLYCNLNFTQQTRTVVQVSWRSVV